MHRGTSDYDPKKNPVEFYYDALVACVDNLGMPQKWQFEMFAKMHELHVLVHDFVQEKGLDEVRVRGGERLNKDFPLINARGLPVRKQDFIDPMHNIEFHISNKLAGIVKDFRDAQLLPNEARGLHMVLREYVEALHNQGICLTQGKTFAESATMPIDPDHDHKRPNQKVRNVFFDVDQLVRSSKGR